MVKPCQFDEALRILPTLGCQSADKFVIFKSAEIKHALVKSVIGLQFIDKLIRVLRLSDKNDCYDTNWKITENHKKLLLRLKKTYLRVREEDMFQVDLNLHKKRREGFPWCIYICDRTHSLTVFDLSFIDVVEDQQIQVPTSMILRPVNKFH